MENYSMLFPTPSSSYFSSLQPVAFSSGMIGAQAAFDHFQGNSGPAGGSFMAVKGDDFKQLAASSDVSHGDPLTEANTCGSDEVMPEKKGGKKVRKPRFAFQTRSQVDILDDGYRWRKYGQKAVKNNRFPRSYYRCTHQGCSVKKQVQRLSKDEGIVVTTYEGTHTHPIEKSNDNFEHILSQMQIYNNF